MKLGARDKCQDCEYWKGSWAVASRGECKVNDKSTSWTFWCEKFKERKTTGISIEIKNEIRKN